MSGSECELSSWLYQDKGAFCLCPFLMPCDTLFYISVVALGLGDLGDLPQADRRGIWQAERAGKTSIGLPEKL